MAVKKAPFATVSKKGQRVVTCYVSYATEGTSYGEKLSEALQENGIAVIRSSFQGSILAFIDITGAAMADALIFIATPDLLRSTLSTAEIKYFGEKREDRVIPIIFPELGDAEKLRLFTDARKLLIEPKGALITGPSEVVISRVLEALERFRKTAPAFLPRPVVLASEKRPLNEGKLILVGRGEVGKTSLVSRLRGKGFRDETKTQGIDINVWELQCGDDTLRLNIWDFGGQEMMHATHQFFLTERSIYLLVLNGREGGEDFDAEYWLKHIESFGANSPVIVVQNKIGQHPFELNYRGLQGRYPQIRGFVKTDCKDKTGIDELRGLIEQIADKMPEMRMEFPAEWFKVKQRLEATANDFMSGDEFRRLCHEEGLDSEADQDTLSWVLHCLGIALNYRDDSRLRETSVLKPEWVTQGIYKILNARPIAERQGELQLDELKQLLPRKQYPVEKHLFLLELMRKFSLCFAFPEERDRYLIPELLGKEESPEAAKFRPAECLNFEYHYGVLPEGLIPRFIVRSQMLSRGQDRWRSGVILAYEDCRALVAAQASDRRIVIRVAGGDAGARRRLLALIRYDLDKINAEFKDRLDVEAKVPLAGHPAFSVDYKKLVAFEKQGVTTFPEFVGQEVVTVNVNELLNGVDFEEQRRGAVETLINAKLVFFSYSSLDEELRDQLETHLKLLQRQGVIAMWHDRKIPPGDDWDREIDGHLERSDIILLLVSADFLSSEYCWGKEIKRAMERHKAKEATVVPVYLRSCDLKNAPFEKVQGLPNYKKPVTQWEDRDAAWTEVAKGIRRIAEGTKRPK